MGISTLILATGTLRPNDDLDGWTITSEAATIKHEEDVELHRGDKISINGDVLRKGHIIARIDLRVGDWGNPTTAARALRAIPSEFRTQASRDNGPKGDPESHRRGGRPKERKP